MLQFLQGGRLQTSAVDQMTVKVIKHAVHEAVETAEQAVKKDVQTQVKVWPDVV